MKKATVVGLGYIGLPLASLLATSGCQVSGVDVNIDLIKPVSVISN